MTKFILAGGADRKFSTFGKRLSQEVNKTTAPRTILSCNFAVPREDWEEKFIAKKEWFEEHFGQGVEVVLAMPNKFEEQVESADLIYLHGGDDTLLHYWLGKYDLSKLFSGKIVVGSSAGANALAHTYWTCDWREVQQGLGLVPGNVITHFESEEYGVFDPRGPINWGIAKEELMNALNNNYPISTLHEGEFVVFEV